MSRIAVYKCLERNTLRVVEVVTPVNRPPSQLRYIQSTFMRWKDEDSKKEVTDSREECCR